MVRPLWFVKAIMIGFPNRFFFAKYFTKMPIIGRLIHFMAFDEDNIKYLVHDKAAIKYTTKTKTVSINKQLDPVENITLPSSVMHHFIDQADDLFIMHFCICRTANNSQTYPQDIGCLFLGKATTKIDRRLGQSVTKEQAHNHIKRAEKAGLTNLIGRNKIDTQWLDAKPGSQLMTCCFCDPVNCLWKMLPNCHEDIANVIQPMPGVKVTADPATCIGCEKCISECIVDAIHMVGDKAVIIPEMCRGCARCAVICPSEAISVKVEDSDFIEQTISSLKKSVNVKSS